jgi:triosephosphate isomerase (TIM)
MRRRMIAGNWKMYKSAEKAIAFLDDLEGSFLPEEAVEVVICPPFVAIPALTGDPRIDLMGIHIGAQNGHWEPEGAFTGEISMKMLRDTGCCYVIVGHSERRMLMGETDETVNKKVKEAMRVGLAPIICVGETAEQRQAGVTAEVVTRQIQGAFQGVDYPEAKDLVVAYEPVWAIGSGTPASPDAMLSKFIV